MTIKQWAKSPKGYVTFSMIAFFLIAAVWARNIHALYNGLTAVAVCMAADFAGGILTRKKRNVPDGALITGLILALILSTAASWFVVVMTSLVSIASKYIFTYKKKPVFNPAAFGLLLSIYLFHSGQSWWGAFGDLPAWTVVFLLIGGYAVTNRVHKFPQVFAFLGTYLILLLVMGIQNVGDATDALRPPFINATLFFAFFMLTDPPTSPARDKDQVIFSILTGLVGAAVYGLFGGLTYLFIGLLSGNLYQFIRARTSSSVSETRRGAPHSNGVKGYSK